MILFFLQTNEKLSHHKSKIGMDLRVAGGVLLEQLKGLVDGRFVIGLGESALDERTKQCPLRVLSRLHFPTQTIAQWGKGLRDVRVEAGNYPTCIVWTTSR